MSPASADETKTSELTPAELWVLNQVKAGTEANLETQFSNADERKLSAKFVEKLLTGKIPDFVQQRHGVEIRGAIVPGPVDLSRTQINQDVALLHCEFDDDVNFTRTHFAASALFDESLFKKQATFINTRVDYTLFLRNATFEGPTSFLAAEVAYDFSVSHSHFNDTKSAGDFNRLKVGYHGNFGQTEFRGGLDLASSDISFVDLTDVVWPKDPQSVNLYGMTFKIIKANPKQHQSHEKLLKLVDQAVYTPDIYGKLDEFFARQGYRDDADKAFMAGKHRERKQLSWWQPAWLGSMLLNLLVGYGRHPWQAILPCAGLVLAGCFLFPGDKMELLKQPEKGEATRVYNRFWYSLGLFLPFVNLQTAELWKPKTKEVFLRNYVRVHILLGWILIPIVLAALTGLIR